MRTPEARPRSPDAHQSKGRQGEPANNEGPRPRKSKWEAVRQDRGGVREGGIEVVTMG